MEVPPRNRPGYEHLSGCVDCAEMPSRVRARPLPYAAHLFSVPSSSLMTKDKDYRATENQHIGDIE